MWHLLGHEAGTLSQATYPTFKPEYLVESEFAYPVSFNGKMKFNLSLALDLDQQTVEEMIKAHADVQRHLDGKPIKKIIFVKGKIINIVA
ncbi:Leucine--tRNA ligase [compost metagenome]